MAFGFIILLYVALRLSYIGATSLWNNEILSRYYGNGRAALTLGSASSLTSPTPPPTISFWCSVCLLCSASEEFSYLGCIAAADNYERGGGGKASCRLLHRTRDPAGDRGETPRLGAIERIRPHSCQRSSRAGALYGLFENGSALKLRALARRVGYCLGSGGVRTDLSAIPQLTRERLRRASTTPKTSREMSVATPAQLPVSLAAASCAYHDGRPAKREQLLQREFRVGDIAACSPLSHSE